MQFNLMWLYGLAGVTLRSQEKSHLRGNPKQLYQTMRLSENMACASSSTLCSDGHHRIYCTPGSKHLAIIDANSFPDRTKQATEGHVSHHGYD